MSAPPDTVPPDTVPPDTVPNDTVPNETAPPDTAPRTHAEADAWLAGHHTARDDGLAAGLTELCGTLGPGVLPCGPTGHALIPRDLARTARRIWYDGVLSDRAAGRDTMFSPALAEDEGLVALRHSQGWLPRPPLPTDEAPGQAAASWRIGLAWLRLGLSERLAGDCLAYLGARELDGGTLLAQQLVQAALADALIGHAEVRAVLTPSSATLGSTDIGWLHGRLTRTDRGLVRLLGGSGFVSAGPGRSAIVSELLADVYVGGTWQPHDPTP